MSSWRVLLLGRTAFGRRVYAIGNGERVAALAGVPVSQTLIRVYMLSGLCSSIVGLLLTASPDRPASAWRRVPFAVDRRRGDLRALITGGRGSDLGMPGARCS